MTRDEIDQAVRDQLAAAPGSSAREIAKALFPDGRDSRTNASRIYDALERLRLRGEIVKTDANRWPANWRLADRSRLIEITALDAALVVTLLRAGSDAAALALAERIEEQLTEGDGPWTMPEAETNQPEIPPSSP